MQLHLIRHPPPQIASGICYGQSDVGVDEQDCRQIAARLMTGDATSTASSSLPRDAIVYSSPLQRCTRLAQHLHPIPILDHRLMELDFGRWEMCAWDQIPRAEIDAWAADTVHYPPGGSENAVAMAYRLLSFANELINGATRDATDVVIVCHAGSIRMLLEWQPDISALELAQKVCAAPRSLDFGACTRKLLLI